jgi:uncharacterized protein YcaQ
VTRAPDLRDLTRHAIARTFFPPTTVAKAITRLGFLQADPIRAPARAQDLTLRHRVKRYRAGDLERRYASLGIEEAFFINYGFLPHDSYALMHPRPARGIWDAKERRRALNLLAFVETRGAVHPRQVEAHFAHGTVTNYWGGLSSATTHLLDAMHYRGWLRIARRDNGVRIYAVSDRRDEIRLSAAEQRTRLDRLIDLVVQTYAPVPQRSLAAMLLRLRYAAPQWAGGLKAAIIRARTRLGRVRIADTDWYLPASERVASSRDEAPDDVRLLAPFDPLVWDRRRFEQLWGWAYRFEAYTPAAKRKLGYYALPLLFREQVIGWGNVALRNGAIDCQLGFVTARPRDAAFDRELDAELERMRQFLTGSPQSE